jgi:MFS family permease
MDVWKKNLYVCWFGVFATSAGLSQLIPILPLYIEQLGVHNVAEIEEWSGIAYGVTFVLMAVFSPIWGAAADRYGRKPMLLRASLGMAIVLSCMGFVQNVYQLVALRFLQGTISGYYSAAITLVATQSPKNRSGWALGTLSTGAVSGMLLGPLLGGALAETLGIRNVFFAIGALLIVAFFAALLFVSETFTPAEKKTDDFRTAWRALPHQQLTLAMFMTSLIMQLALMSIQPILTVYISELSNGVGPIAMLAGMAFAASGLASILAAPRLGSLADRIGPPKVMVGALLAAGVIFIPQALVQNVWQLIGLRFLLGISTASLLPSINSMIRKITPDESTGRIFGYNQSAQFIGSFGGAVMGGQIASAVGIHYVFFSTSSLLLLNAAWVYFLVCRKTIA